MGKFVTIIMLALALSGCVKTRYVYETIEVPVPIVGPCIDEMPGSKEYAYLDVNEKTSEEQDFDLAQQGIIQHRAMEAELRELMKPCIKKGP